MPTTNLRKQVLLMAVRLELSRICDLICRAATVGHFHFGGARFFVGFALSTVGTFVGAVCFSLGIVLGW